MYVIITYDVNVKRVNRVKKFLRMHMNWVQNSVFEGELTESELLRIKSELKKIINEDEDSIFLYILRTKAAMRKEVLGIERSSIESIL
ncbi:CRISPR-associated endonuclease Cas2 [Candidatus Alkanophaga liquidiphilum]|nr:CRISPR/Cas system-associated endoribonuclease Cas2 [Candidatus Alkanophaga liquidiphilum]